MWFLFLIFLQLSALSIQATKYKLHFGPLKIIDFNKDYIIDATSALFENSDSKLAYNFSLTYRVPIASGLMMHSKMFIFQAKAYRKFPYDFDINVCDMFKKNEFGVHYIYNISNIRECPAKANIPYYCNNLVVDPEKIPKNILIPGKFKIDTRMGIKTVNFLHMDWFVEIIPEKH